MIRASVIADSINQTGTRITTLELEYPRFIHAQFMTHRVFSRSASSSRAIPIEKLIERVENDPASPIRWGKNQRGMQADQDFSDADVPALKAMWVSAKNAAVSHASKLSSMGVHKQIVNRLLEPFAHINVVVTATEWENFFNLRRGDEAQPEIQELANVIWDARNASIPTYRSWYHLPYVSDEERERFTTEECLAFSVARCARVSYTNHGSNVIDHDKDKALHDVLLRDGHMSPFEHQARPIVGNESHISNFIGWVQYRKLIPGEAVYRNN